MVKEQQTMATLLILGTCFLVIVAGVYLVRLLRWEKIRKLQHQGKRVLAIVTSVQLECEERGPAEFPLLNYCYYIEAEWTDPQTGNTYLFKSNRLASSPKEYSPGRFVQVLMDPNRPTRYVMELPEYNE